MAKRKAPYVCVEPRHLQSSVVRGLASGKSPFELYAFLLLCPLSKPVPGVLFCGLGALRDELPGDWTDDELRRALNELSARGLVLFDGAARVLFLPELLKQQCNAAVSSTQATCWRDVMDEGRCNSDVFVMAETALIKLLMSGPEHVYASYLAGKPLTPSDAKRYLRSLISEQVPTPAPFEHLPDPMNPQLQFEFRADAVASAPAVRSTPATDRPPSGIASVEQSASPVCEGSNPSLPTSSGTEACAAHAPAAAPSVPDDFLLSCFPSFRQRAGKRLGLAGLPIHDTLTGLPEGWDRTLRERWALLAAGYTADQADALWERLADLVVAGRFDRLTAPVHRRWMVLIKHFERYAQEARQLQRGAGPRPLRIKERRTYADVSHIADADPQVLALARRVAPELVTGG